MFWTLLGYASIPGLTLAGIAITAFVACVLMELFNRQ